MNNITQESLKAELHYDNIEGVFSKIGKRRKPWRLVANEKNYSIEVLFQGNYYPAECLAWLYVCGGEYRTDIVHKNRDPMDNKYANLDIGVFPENITPSLIGVSAVPGGGWRAYCTVDGKQKYLGKHDDYLDACCARKRAELKYGIVVSQSSKRGVAGKRKYPDKRSCVTCEISKCVKSFSRDLTSADRISHSCNRCIKKFGWDMYGKEVAR